MELRSARLGHGSDQRWPLLVLCAEIRSEDLELLQEIGVRVHRSRTVASRIRNVGAIGHDIQRVVLKAVVGEVVVQRALAAGISVGVDAYGLPAIACLVSSHGRGVNAESGSDLYVLSGIAADLGEVLQFLGREGKRLFAGVHRGNRKILRAYFYRLGGAGEYQTRIDIAPFASAHADLVCLVGLEALGLDSKNIGTHRHGSKSIVAFTIANGFAQ